MFSGKMPVGSDAAGAGASRWAEDSTSAGGYFTSDRASLLTTTVLTCMTANAGLLQINAAVALTAPEVEPVVAVVTAFSIAGCLAGVVAATGPREGVEAAARLGEITSPLSLVAGAVGEAIGGDAYRDLGLTYGSLFDSAMGYQSAVRALGSPLLSPATLQAAVIDRLSDGLSLVLGLLELPAEVARDVQANGGEWSSPVRWTDPSTWPGLSDTAGASGTANDGGSAAGGQAPSADSAFGPAPAGGETAFSFSLGPGQSTAGLGIGLGLGMDGGDRDRRLAPQMQR